MNKKYFAIFSALLACFCVSAQEPAPEQSSAAAAKPKKVLVPKNTIATPEYRLSNERVQQMRTIVEAHYNKHEDLESEETKGAIQGEIGRLFPLTPKILPDNKTVMAIRDSLQGKVNLKFNKELASYQAELKAEFDKNNPLYKRKDQITIYYTRGSATHRVSGYYYGLGVGGNTVRINSRHIPVIDILPEYRVRFDSAYHAQKCKEYVDKNVAVYERKRLKYEQSLVNEEMTKQRKHNEKLGYILRDGVWETPQKILNEIMKEMIAKQKIRAAEEARQKAELEKNKPQDSQNNQQKKSEESDEEEEEE